MPLKPTTTRRRFVRTGAAAAATSTFLAGNAHAAGASETLRVGLIGCGGRGTQAAMQALRADKDVKLVAMADAFADKIESGLERLANEEDLTNKIDVPPERRFAGFEGYKEVTDNVDVVLLTATPHFRPRHLRYAVEKGKHVFAEKPVAVDGAGVRSVLESCQAAKRKGLSIVSGLCLRYYNCFEETMKKIHDGELGEVLSLQANDYRSGIWDRSREELAKVLGRAPTEMEYQMRNWYHFTWLSGDFNVEQHVHFLDICAWAMKDRYPDRCVCIGARQRRPDNGGNIYDQFSAVYEYDRGARIHAHTRHLEGNHAYRDISAEVTGTKGRGVFSESDDKHRLTIGGREWRFSGERNDFYQTEHDRLFAAIRAGEPINNGDYMARSTLMAIMARESAYTGQAVTWEQALNSKQDLSPERYGWDAAPPPSPIAVPGVTRFV